MTETNTPSETTPTQTTTASPSDSAPAATPAPAPTPEPAPEGAPAPEGHDQLLLNKDNEKTEGEQDPDKKNETEEKPKEGDPKPEDDQPIEYKEFAIPEDMPAPKEVLDEFKGIASKFKLTQDAAQEMLNLHIKMNQRMNEEARVTVNEWRQQTEEHPKLGGENLKKTINSVDGLIRNHASSPEHLARCQDIIVGFGIGNNPDIIELLHNIAEKTREDSMDGSGQNPGQGQKSLPERLWPGMYK